MVVSGSFDEAIIKNAWFDIQSEYADIIGDQSMKKYLTSFKKYCFYEATITQAELLLVMIPRIIVHGITIGKDFHLYGEIQKSRHSYIEKFNNLFNSTLIFTDDTFEDDVETGHDYINNLSLRMDIEAQKLKKLEETNKVDKTPITRGYFYDTLITLTDHAKVRLDENMTVYEFAQRIKRYEEYCKTFQAKTKWQKSS